MPLSFTNLNEYFTVSGSKFMSYYCAKSLLELAKFPITTVSFKSLVSIAIEYNLAPVIVNDWLSYNLRLIYQSGAISSKNQLAPYYVLHSMSDLPGMAGFYLATLFCGSLSTLSSGKPNNPVRVLN